MKKGKLRAVAATVVARVAYDGESLTAVLQQTLQNNDFKVEDNSLLQALCYGTIRFMPRWQAIIRAAMEKPLKDSEAEISALLAVGLFQLQQSRIPPHAAISETVSATQVLNKNWAKGLVNAILRRLQREPEWQLSILEKQPWAAVGFPRWIWKRLKKEWPEYLSQIIEGSNLQAPMTIRVNSRKFSVEDYVQLLAENNISASSHPLAKDALILETALAVERLPQFDQGSCSVQDVAAQMAVEFLDIKKGQRILDACSAPGGKTGHILEKLESGHCVAIDKDAKRLLRVQENLQRLELKAECVTADAADTKNWWDGEPFDRILLDAPCSGTGVIRRHPDIKLLRRQEDIIALREIQMRLLESLWLLLKPGGKLVYATCSIFDEENSQQISQFLTAHEDASLIPIQQQVCLPVPVGWQIYPGWQQMDGFYYAVVEKSAKTL